MSANETSILKNSMRHWLKSALVWMLFFSLFCLCVAMLVPGRCLSAADGVTGTFRVLVTKLASFLPSSEQPDIVVLGSSLVLVPAVRCDDRLAGKSPCYERWYYDRYIPEYSQSVYLQKQLEKKTGLNLTIKNLGVASSIMSDQYGILKLLLAEEKHPKLLIIGLAPRDFLDNSQQKHLETPTRLFMREYNESSFWPGNWTLDGMQGACIKIEHRLEKVFALIRTKCTNLACRLSGHEPLAEYSSGQTYVGDRPNRLKDLDTYKKLYNPPNFAMLTTQSKYLSRLLALAQKHNVAVLVINMPLTRENTDTLDQQALTAYIDTLSRLTSKYAAGFLNIGSTSSDYSLKDFEDCCHLNSRGGEKFYASLISYLTSNNKLIASLNVKQTNKSALARQNASNSL